MGLKNNNNNKSTEKLLRNLISAIQLSLQEAKADRLRAEESRIKADEDRARAEEDRQQAQERFEEYVRRSDEKFDAYEKRAAQDRRAMMLLIRRGFKLGDKIIQSLQRIENRLKLFGNGSPR